MLSVKLQTQRFDPGYNVNQNRPHPLVLVRPRQRNSPRNCNCLIGEMT